MSACLLLLVSISDFIFNIPNPIIILDIQYRILAWRIPIPRYTNFTIQSSFWPKYYSISPMLNCWVKPACLSVFYCCVKSVCLSVPVLFLSQTCPSVFLYVSYYCGNPISLFVCLSFIVESNLSKCLHVGLAFIAGFNSFSCLSVCLFLCCMLVCLFVCLSIISKPVCLAWLLWCTWPAWSDGVLSNEIRRSNRCWCPNERPPWKDLVWREFFFTCCFLGSL